MTARSTWGLALVLLATAVIYLPVLSFDFVTLDDYAYVRNNPDVVAPTLARAFALDNLVVSDWTPLGTLMHAVEYRLWGLDPRGYHAVNLLLHLITVVLVFHLLHDLGVNDPAALLATAIFSLHPLQVESVAWISSRKNLLCLLFGLAGTLAFVRNAGLLACLLLLLALASKATAVVFPAWWAALLAFGRVSIPRPMALRWLALYACLAVLRVGLSVTAQAHVMASREVGAMPFDARMSIMGRVVVQQLYQFVWPADLRIAYFWSPAPWNEWRVVMPWLLLPLFVAVVVAIRRYNRAIPLAALLTALSFLPTANLVPAPAFQADRYAHLPLVTASYLAVATIAAAGFVHRMLPALILAAWLAVAVVPNTIARIAVWHNSETLWRSILPLEPAYAFGWDWLSRHYLEVGNLEAAEPAVRRAVELNPDNLDARLNLALLLAHRGRPEESRREAEAVLHAWPRNVSAHLLMASLVAQTDRKAAMTHLDAVLRIEPAHPQARTERSRIAMADEKPIN